MGASSIRRGTKRLSGSTAHTAGLYQPYAPAYNHTGERNRPNKNARKRGIGAHIYHSFSRLQSHSIERESTPRYKFTEEGSSLSTCKCSEKAQRGRIPTLLHIPTPKPPIKNHVVCTLRIEGRSNHELKSLLSFEVVCTLRIEGRSNGNKEVLPKLNVVCTLRIEGRSNATGEVDSR